MRGRGAGGYMTKEGHRGGAHFGRAGCEPEKVRHQWRMGDGESRLIELYMVGDGWAKREWGPGYGGCLWVRELTQGRYWIT